MRHILRGCRHRKPASAKATYLLGDMATYLRPYFFLFILDMWRSKFTEHKFLSALPKNGKSLEAAVRRYTLDLKNEGAT